MTRTGRRTVPQIYIGDHHVGGYDDLAALERAGKLAKLLAGEYGVARRRRTRSSVAVRLRVVESRV